jgi:methionine sulfoxide reductase catalytic subunit
MVGKEPPASEITPEALYLRRREFMRNAALFTATSTAVGGSLLWLMRGWRAEPKAAAIATPDLAVSRHDDFAPGESPTPYRDVTTYNNFYEFGLEKSDPAEYAGSLHTRPWTITVEGEVRRPQVIDIDQLLGWFPLEERVYRMRCVEAWSMVIPWVGIPLASVLKRAEPTSKATFVEFTTVLRPKEMPGLSYGGLDWPYTEGLRLDEAMHPLTLLVVGLYGKTLLNQNGAPLRLVVPWKYGFKGAKSIVRIRLVDKMPRTSWVEQNPVWYGFYSNVNPNVSPVRWDQGRERRLPSLFATTKTLMFNGYGDQVASMYAGMDLKKYY